jgi:glycosyltransferase involved in cell wall biosynthesis
MKIGIDIRTFIASQFTGVGIYTWETLSHLFQTDAENQFILYTNHGRGSSLKKVADWKKYANVKVYETHFPSKLLNFSLNYLKRPFLDKMIGGVDLLWFPNLNFWQISPQAKVIVTIHDLSYVLLPQAFSPKMRLWHKIITPRKKLERADKIIAVSENTKNDLMNLYRLPAAKIKVIHSAISHFDQVINLQSVKQKYHLPDNFILYFGTLEPRKNVEGLIRAFEKITQPDCHLVIAGGEGWLYRKIYHLAKKSKKKSLIHFTNYIEPADRPALYQLAQMLVWPTFYEGFGFPPLEAMKMGCPVITSANSSLPEIVGQAALLINPYNINEIALAIDQLLTNEELRQNLINQGYQQIEKYSWSETVKQLLAVFKSLA